MRTIDADALLTEMKCSGKAAYMLVQEAPTIDPKPQWIPCSDRFPECENGSESKEAVLFQLRDTGTIEVGYYGRGGKYKDSYFRSYRDRYEGFSSDCVIAWMPLPEPYDPEEVEQEGRT